MNCRHCLAWNSAELHRCHRCGRRHTGSAQAAASHYPIQTATAPAYDFSDARQLVGSLDKPDQTHPRRVVFQKHLFDPQVVQLPMPSGPASRVSGRRRTSAKVGRYHPAQQAFDFDPEAVHQTYAEAENQPLDARAQDSIYCDSPVAQPIHRLMAAALDSSMIVIALGLFLLTFHVCGGTVVLNSKTATLYVGIYAVMWFFYHALYGVCSADTPGMLWTDLRLVNFEGESPDREQRIYRMFGGVLGFLSIGLGLVWSLVDEEQLTWHDHISKTFPSPLRM